MLNYEVVLRCKGTEEELSNFWEEVLDDDYEEVTLCRMENLGVGILRAPLKKNAIVFHTEHNIVEWVDKLSKSHPNIQFEVCVNELELGPYELYIFKNGEQFGRIDHQNRIDGEIIRSGIDQKYYPDPEDIPFLYLDWASKQV
ncbi:MAG: hypothetical protein LBU84_10700 [Prevotella sp.]|nr:hypothetical protein [Prevotella sp.]